MSDTGKKDDFKWQVGETLDEGAFSPLGNIRSYGLPKINKAPAKDPVVRKRERESFLADRQSQPYKSEAGIPAVPDRDIISEGDQNASDLSGKFEDSDVKRLTDKGNRTRGFDRFGKKT